jgi:hypothetical protein
MTGEITEASQEEMREGITGQWSGRLVLYLTTNIMRYTVSSISASTVQKNLKLHGLRKTASVV